MTAKLQSILSSLYEQLSFIELEIDEIEPRCEKSVEIILKSIEKIKGIALKSGFKTEHEEIMFFKEIKPQFTSKLIYYNSLYKIETKKPSGGARILKKYYNNELIKLKRYFENNLDFYKYYRLVHLNYFLTSALFSHENIHF